MPDVAAHNATTPWEVIRSILRRYQDLVRKVGYHSFHGFYSLMQTETNALQSGMFIKTTLYMIDFSGGKSLKVIAADDIS